MRRNTPPQGKKCRKCKTYVVICSECGAAYKKDTKLCDMCGRELLRKWRIRPAKVDRQSDLAPRDLVSVINRVRSKSIGVGAFRALWWIGTVALLATLVFTVLVGFMAGDLLSDLMVMAISGESIDEISAHFVNTPARNFKIWTAFIGEITKSDATFAHFLKFSNYLVSASFLPILVMNVFCIFFYVPLSIVEKLCLGIITRKKGYSASDTVMVFERPTLIYNSNDSFDKAYTYFPFMEKTKGRTEAVAADLLYYGANIICCLSGLCIHVGQTLIKVTIRVVSEHLYFSSDALVTFMAAMAVILYAAVLLAVWVVVKLVIRALRRNQLKKWQIKNDSSN